MDSNGKTDVSQTSKVQSAKDTIRPKPSTYGTPLPPKTTPRSGK